MRLFTVDKPIYCAVFSFEKMQISWILEDKSIICTAEIVPVNQHAPLDAQERKTMSGAAGKWAAFPMKNTEKDMLPFCVES